MAKTPIAASWTANSTPPYADQSYPNGDRPASAEFSDADYIATPSYDENGALFFNSAATGANNGTSWDDGYTDAETALNALCGMTTNRRMYFRGTLDLGAVDINLFGDGGVGASDNWFYMLADPINGCNITGTSANGIVFGGQQYWLIDGFNITGGGRLWSYQNFVQGGGVNHMVWRHLTGAMSVGGDNVGAITIDAGSDAANSDYIGVFNSQITGPGVGAHGNTGCIYFTRPKRWRVQNCELSNAPHGIYWKHFESTNAETTSGTQFFKDNYVYGCTDAKFACSNAIIQNNIFDCDVVIANDGGGDDGCDNNTIENNTITGYLDLSRRDTYAQGNALLNNISEGTYFIFDVNSVQSSTNTSDYSLYGNDTIQYNGTNYTLTSWQSSSVPAGQDANSISGTPTYVGGVSPVTISGFALDSGSLGKGAGSDGNDIGASALTVGVN